MIATEEITKQQTYSKTYYASLKGRLVHMFNAMKQRCENPKHPGYELCGAKGIKCLFTLESFFRYIIIELGFNKIELLKGLCLSRINVLNNFQRGNLCFAYRAYPGVNRSKYRSYAKRKPASRYMGVTYAHSNQWKARCNYNGKEIYCGCHASEELAAEAYDQMVVKLHGPDVLTNRRAGLLNQEIREPVLSPILEIMYTRFRPESFVYLASQVETK